VAGENRAPCFFTAFGNQYWNHKPVGPHFGRCRLQIFNYAISPYEDWHRQAWGAPRRAWCCLLLVTAINVSVRVLTRDRFGQIKPMNSLMPADKEANRPAIRPEPEAASIQTRPQSPRRRPCLPWSRPRPGVSRPGHQGPFRLFRQPSGAQEGFARHQGARAVTAIIGPSGLRQVHVSPCPQPDGTN